MKIDLIAGARPNFMKIASVIDAIEASQKKGGNIHYRLIHTGQHYDTNMSDNFFKDLGLPVPHINLGAGSGSQASQTAAIMTGYEKELEKKCPDMCMVVGDVTSTMACAIVARKMLVDVAHVEAGIRSNDWTMPEEINRIVTDSITNYFFTTTETANQNLLKSGFDEKFIFFVGNTMIDTLLKQMPHFRKPSIWDKVSLKKQEYIVMTLHRPANVDEETKLWSLLDRIVSNSHGIPLIFPVHPRTQKVLKNIAVNLPNLHLIEPLSYLEFNYLVKYAKAVITDSGGITEETTVMGVPCMTLRDTTERPETITIGTNELLGTDPSAIDPAMDTLFKGNWKKGGIPEKWDGKAAIRIIEYIERLEPGIRKAEDQT